MKFLGLIDIPLPDNVWAEFAFTLLLWAIAAAIIILAIAPILMVTARMTHNQWYTKTLQALRIPGIALIILYGLADSLSILTESWVNDDGITIKAPLSEGAAANVIVGVELLLVLVTSWLIFRVFNRAVIPFFKEFAAHTETKLDDVMVPLVEKVGSVIIVIFAITAVLDKLGINPGVALAGMGIAGLVIAFAAQDTLSNFFSGIFLMLDRPFEVGDTILLDEKERADVLDIGLRSCRLYDRRLNTLVIMPNNRIASSKITNLTKPDPYFRVAIDVGVAYDSDPVQVRDILYKVAREHPNVITDDKRPIRSRFQNFGNSALEFRLICWVDDVNLKNNYMAEMRHTIYDEFKRQGIVIPFPQRVVHAAPKLERKLETLAREATD